MRIALVGTAHERAQWRNAFRESRIAIVAEFESREDLRRAGIEADAIVLSASRAGQPHGDAEFPVQERVTPRELDVLELLAEGLPNKEIGRRLQISDQTVKFHVSSICGKLGASNRTDAVRRALRRGLISV